MVGVVSELSRRLADAKGDRTIDEIAEMARREGHQLDRSVVARYLKGEHGRHPRQSTLEALAVGFHLDVRELRRLAGRPAGELGPYEPTPESASLTKAQRDALDYLIKAIVKGENDERPAAALQKMTDPDPGVGDDEPELYVPSDQPATTKSRRPRV